MVSTRVAPQFVEKDGKQQVRLWLQVAVNTASA